MAVRCSRESPSDISLTHAPSNRENVNTVAQLNARGLIDTDTKQQLWRSMRTEANLRQAVAAHLAYPHDDVQFAEWCLSVLLD